ncbi:SLATT domain-containing protein [Streptomyces sp. NPDC001970]
MQSQVSRRELRGTDERRRRRDLRTNPFPSLSPGTAQQNVESLEQIRAWAERETEDAIDWYLRDKRLKRKGSRGIRALTVALAVSGAVIPLAGAASGGQPDAWGYVVLAAAAGCKGFDYFFGLSSGWMRDIKAAQALQRELNDFQLAWSRELLRASDGTAGDAPVADALLERRLALVAGLIVAVRGHVEAETAEWLAEFSSTGQQIQQQQGALPPA